MACNESVIHRHHLLIYELLSLYRRTYISVSGCTQGPHKSPHYVTLSMIINTVRFHEFFNGRQLYSKSRMTSGSDFLLDSPSATWLQCFHLFILFHVFFSAWHNPAISKVHGVSDRSKEMTRQRLDERRAKWNEDVHRAMVLIQYLCVIWDYSGSEDSHCCQIKKERERKKIQGSDTNFIQDKRRRWWQQSWGQRFVDVIWSLQTDSDTEWVWHRRTSMQQ